MSATQWAVVPKEVQALPACVYGRNTMPNGKPDKAPRHPDTLNRISTTDAAPWVDFAQAAAAAHQRPENIGGVGVLMQRGVVGVDIDNAFMPDGVTLKAGPRGIVEALGTWGEVSMSGQGLHLFCTGDLTQDSITSKAIGSDGEAFGLEVYGGNAGRYLALTGRHFAGTPATVQPFSEDALAVLNNYRRSAPTNPKKEAAPVAELLEESTLPTLDELCGVMGHDTEPARFLRGEFEPTDRSETLREVARGLRWCGLDAQQILSVMAHNPHTWGVATDKRQRGDAHAVEYLWLHHAAKAADDVSSLDVMALFDVVPEAQGEAAEGGGIKFGGLVLQTLAQLAQREKPEWLIRGLLPRAEIGAIFGASGAGKTFFSLHMAAALCNGGEFYGRTAKQVPVAYCALEGVSGFGSRCAAYTQRHSVAMDGLHVLSGALNLLAAGSERPVIQALKAICGRGVVFVDTLAQATPGADESSSRDMGAALARLKAIHAATGWLVLVIAHSGKDTTKGLRGWSGIKAALDFEIEVVRTHQYRAATVTKLKDGPGEGAEYRFTLEDVVLGFDKDEGENLSAGVLVEGEAMGTGEARAQAAAPKARGANQQAVFAAFTAAGGGPMSVAELLRDTTPRLITGAADKRRDRAREALNALTLRGVLVLDGNTVAKPPNLEREVF